MTFDEADPMKVVRNTRTLRAYRTRSAAAQRAGMPFLVIPILLNPAICLPIIRRFEPSSSHVPLWPLLIVFGAWFALMCASLGYGAYRRRRYLLNHPLTGELEGVGRLVKGNFAPGRERPSNRA